MQNKSQKFSLGSENARLQHYVALLKMAIIAHKNRIKSLKPKYRLLNKKIYLGLFDQKVYF